MTILLDHAKALTDDALLARVQSLAADERRATAELVAHLAELDTREMLYAARGYGSLFSYCTRALGLSEDAAGNRIAAARTCRRFPVPRPPGVRRGHADRRPDARAALDGREPPERPRRGARPDEGRGRVARRPPGPAAAHAIVGPTGGGSTARAHRGIPVRSFAAGAVGRWGTAGLEAPPLVMGAPRAVVLETAPERYRVQFTIGQETHQKLRRLQELLAREVPGGDPAAIVDLALSVLLERSRSRSGPRRPDLGGLYVPERMTGGEDHLRRDTSRPTSSAP